MKQDIQTIIWDWNGTLLDDMDICVDSINVLLEKRGLPLMDLVKYRSLFTFPVIRYYETIGFDFTKEPYDEVAMEFIHIYLEKLKEALLFPEVAGILGKFKEKGHRQAILSAMEQENLSLSVESKGISNYFSLILGTDDHFANGKVYQVSRIIRELNAEPAKTLIIGDTLHDHEVAEEAGCQCILVAAGHQNRERLEKSGCIVVNKLSELLSLFN
jgi:phosphoglycolate phosphatase